MEKGMEKGINQQKLQTAQSMLRDHLPLEMIIKYTGLSKEEIEKAN